MDILNTLKQLRDDLKAWVTVNLNALNAKIDEKTIPIDSELNTTSTNPVQNKAIASEIDDINKRVGNTSVETQISSAVASKSYFSGDYNDLANAPNIIEDDSGNMTITDENSNIIFRVDTDGIHTTTVTAQKAVINGADVVGQIDELNTHVENNNIHVTTAEKEVWNNKSSFNGSYNDLIDVPTDLATEDYVDNKVADLVNSAPEALNTLGELAVALENHEDAYDALLETVGNKTTYTDLESLKAEISESIKSEDDEWTIVDSNGNIIFNIDANGAHTTSLSLNGEDIAETLKTMSSAHATKEHTHPIDDIDELRDELNWMTEEINWMSDEINNYTTSGVVYLPIHYEEFDRDTLTFIGCTCDMYEEDIWVENIINHVFGDYGDLNITIPVPNAEYDYEIMKLSLSRMVPTFDNNMYVEFSAITKFDNQLMRVFAVFDIDNNITAGFEPIEFNDDSVTRDEMEDYIEEVIDAIELPKTDLSNYYTKTESDTALNNLKTELSESIVSESKEWTVVDNEGNIVATIDANGIETTTMTAQSIVLNGIDINDIIETKVRTYIDEAILGGAW